MEIVTGLRGTPHITSADVIGFQQGIATVGSGALPVGEKFRAELASNNELKIYDGEGVIQGVHFRVLPGTYDSITLENGSQGQKRKDLIVVKYTKNAQTGYENTEWVVKKGTSTTETPVEPTATEGDVRAGDILAEVPWYVVEYDGINVTSVTPKFSTLMNIQELTEGFSSLNSNFVSGNLGSFRITHQLVSLTYASATELAGFMYCGADVAAATATIIYQNSTPIDQVDRLYIDIGPYNTPSRINIHAHGTGFISGHILKVAVIVITTPA